MEKLPENNLLSLTANLVQKRIDVSDRLAQIKQVIENFTQQDENKSPERMVVQKNINDMLQGFEELSESIQSMSKDLEQNVQTVSKYLKNIFKQTNNSNEKYEVQILKVDDEYYSVPINSISEFLKLDIKQIRVKNNIKFYQVNNTDYQIIDLG